MTAAASRCSAFRAASAHSAWYKYDKARTRQNSFSGHMAKALAQMLHDGGFMVVLRRQGDVSAFTGDGYQVSAGRGNQTRNAKARAGSEQGDIPTLSGSALTDLLQVGQGQGGLRQGAVEAARWRTTSGDWSSSPDRRGPGLQCRWHRLQGSACL